MASCDVVVIGAGASGTMAAVHAARLGAHVTVLEADCKPCRKLLRTGNGRCNLTNSGIELSGAVCEAGDACETDAVSGSVTASGSRTVSESATPRLESAPPLSLYRNASFASHVLGRFGCTEIRGMFSDMGLVTYEDIEGRVYPVTNKARSVADVLANECSALGVDLQLDSPVALVERHDGIWTCRTEDGRLFHSKAVVLAAGGASKIADDLGIPVVARSQVLGPLRTDRDTVKLVDGIRMRCSLALERPEGTDAGSGGTGNTDAGSGGAGDRAGRGAGGGAGDRAGRGTGGDVSSAIVAEMSGEVLFRKYGISGIVVFDLSRYARVGDVVVMDMLPGIPREELLAQIHERMERSAARKDPDPLHVFDGLLQREVASAILKRVGFPLDGDPSRIPAEKVADELKSLRLQVQGVALDGEPQVMRGGIDVSAMDPRTMAVPSLEGLYACGEAIDVDGACGGYNLHWAWASGAVAGQNAATGGA